ncbi:2OG-Fe dioxygenase family protein [Saccharomonospora sp. NPDC046836]|uniref:2OG-Fe dioxygenase family protein n=1 Tax=Saccharomonospora sp. NPDC046836 TaxID=3156921 RepID=UPI0033E279F6
MALEAVQLGQKKLSTDGYVVLTEAELGFPASAREHLHRTFFHRGVLKLYPNDLPVDRERARDVVRFEWAPDGLRLSEHDTITIENRGERPEAREYGRVEVLADPQFEAWIRGALALLPPEWRDPRGTFGVNLFRTFTNVVTKPHQDGERFIFIYVVDKIGQGAQTWLYGLDDDTEPVFRGTLSPGDLLVFEDARFRHTVTPLEAPVGGGTARRDALVCTVNYPHTYSLNW